MRLKSNKKAENINVQGKRVYLIAIYLFFLLVSLPIYLFWGFTSLFLGIGYEYASIGTLQSDLLGAILYDVIILLVQLLFSKLAYLKHKNRKHYMICKIISYMVFAIFICFHLIQGYNNYIYFFHGR